MGWILHGRDRQGGFATGLRILGGLALGILIDAGPARGQTSVGFQPTFATFPDGLILNAAPVVSVDRRYVRLGLQPQSTTLLGFDVFTIPAAVRSGVGAGGVGVGRGVDGFSRIRPGLGPTMTAQGSQIPRFDPVNAPGPGVRGGSGYGPGSGMDFHPAMSPATLGSQAHRAAARTPRPSVAKSKHATRTRRSR